MPNQSDSVALGRKAEDWFTHALPLKWNLQPPKTDVGIDGIVVICDNSNLNGLEFRVQIKSSSRWRFSRGECLVPHVKKSTLRYWFASPLPLLLALYDHSTNTCSYVWHDQLWDQVDDLSDSTGKDVTLRIRNPKPLTKESWNDVRKELHSHYSALARTFAAARTAEAILPTIRALTEAAKGLMFVHIAKPSTGHVSEEQERLLLLMDVVCHRDAVAGMRKLIAGLHPNAQSITVLNSFVKAYAEEVSTFVVPFDDHVLGHSDAAVRVNADRMRLLRPRLIESLLDTILLLTGKTDTG